MPFAIDLNPRQSARTLEQAIRHRAEVLVEPRIWPETDPIVCHIESTSDPRARGDRRSQIIVLSFRPDTDAPANAAPAPAGAPPPPEEFQRLVGTYCDLAIRMGEHVYLCSSDVIRVERPVAGEQLLRLHLSRPEMLQVAQRRRYRRYALAQSAKVRILWRREGEPPGEGTGWLCNISQEGLACRTDTRLAEQIWIGETMRVDFTLAPTDTQRFVFDAVICNKTPAGTEGKMIVGMKLLTSPQHAASLQMAEALRLKLGERGLLATRRPDEESFL